MKQVDKITKKYIWLSIVISIILVLVCYFFDNIAYPIKLDVKKYSILEHRLGEKASAEDDCEDAVFVNVSFDKMFIVDTSEVPDTNRKSVITDRGKLLEFLKKVENLNYRYLFIDLRFEENDRSEYDSALVEQLLKMRDVSIAKHWDVESGKPYPMIDKRLESIGDYCDFDESKSSAGFCKYQYLQNGDNSIALKMYYKATGRTISKYGPFYFDGASLCRNAQFIVIHKSMASEWQPDLKFNYHHMGLELLSDSNCWNRFCDAVSGNFLIVGNMKEDMHDTYVGKQPGAYLHWLGFKSLLNKNHLVHCMHLLLLGFIFFAITFVILRGGLLSLSEHFKALLWVEQRPLIHFFISLFGYGILLTFISVISYLAWDTAVSIFIPSTVFALLNNCVKFNKMRNKNQEMRNKQ